MLSPKREKNSKRARAMSRSGLVSLDHVLRYSQNVEFGLFFVLNRVEEVKYIAAHPAQSTDKIDDVKFVNYFELTKLTTSNSSTILN